MRNISQRISQLLCRKRAPPPICETTVLINFAACGFADKGFIAHRISKTAHHGGNLRVDGRRGDNAGLFVKYFNILPATVHHLGHCRVYQQVIEWLQVDALGQRVNHAFKAIARRLNEAEFRPECMFA